MTPGEKSAVREPDTAESAEAAGAVAQPAPPEGRERRGGSDDDAGAEPRAPLFEGAPFMRAVLVLNIVVFVAELLVAADANAVLKVPARVGMALGANYASATLYEGRLETLLSGAFIHWSFWHIGFNMYALVGIGPFLERSVGTGRIASMYVGAGIIGSMFSTLDGWIEREQRLGAGASGAICGLLGAALVAGYRAGGLESPLLRSTARWLATVLAFGFIAPHIDNAAHIGGAVAGALFAALWDGREERPSTRTLGLSFAIAAIGLSGAAVAARDVVDPFATQGVGERLAMANAALQDGRCADAWAAAQAARRLAQRDPPALRAVEIVREACGK